LIFITILRCTALPNIVGATVLSPKISPQFAKPKISFEPVYIDQVVSVGLVCQTRAKRLVVHLGKTPKSLENSGLLDEIRTHFEKNPQADF